MGCVPVFRIEMLRGGAKRDELQAKAFGGGSLLEPATSNDNFFCVREVNSRFIREFLTNEGIPLVTADLGGDRGRVIHFCFDDFSIYVRSICGNSHACFETAMPPLRRRFLSNMEDYE